MFYAQADSDIARALERFFALFQRRGEVSLWTPGHVSAGTVLTNAIEEAMRRADVLLLILSADFLAEHEDWIRRALRQRADRQARVIPILARPCMLPEELRGIAALPRDRPLSMQANRDAALLDVVESVRSVLQNLPSQEVAPLAGFAEPEARDEVRSGDDGNDGDHDIERVFRPYGMPGPTLVEPEQLRRLRAELRSLGRGLIVEGPSKVGKTTAVRMALRDQHVPAGNVRWLDGKRLDLSDESQRLLPLLGAMENGHGPQHLIIDDFHYVKDPETLRQLAIYMKVLADQDQPRSKITLIGISPLGGSLTRSLPDLSGRFWLVQMDRQPDTKIAEMITLGEAAARIKFTWKDQFITEADGNFHIAQLLCLEAVRMSGVRRGGRVQLSPDEVIDGIQAVLRQQYLEPLRNFVAWDERVPPRGAGLALLWLLSRGRDGYLSIEEARQRFPAVDPALRWLQASHLSDCFATYPDLTQLFFYNRNTGMLSLEDPRLRFYLRKLDWDELAQMSGHVGVRFHQQDGPIFPVPRRAEGVLVDVYVAESGAPAEPSAQRRPDAISKQSPKLLLHLSDLHLTVSDIDQIARLYGPLSQDLRAQGIERLDGLIVSGDLGTVAAPKEYVAARQFLEELMAGFSLSARQVALVPGNHDLDWDLSQQAYQLVKRAQLPKPPAEGTFIAHGDQVIEVRSDEKYRQRFAAFAELYLQIKGENYPLLAEEQATVTPIAEAGVLVLGLNSAFDLDHHFKDRASLNEEAMNRALLKLPADPPLRIVVFHHPLLSEEGAADRIHNPKAAQQLLTHGFRLALHGHVHAAGDQVYRFSGSPGGKELTVVAGGTFGAPVRQWVPGYPLQYNLLLLGRQDIVVRTRRRRDPSGAWEADGETAIVR